MTGSDTSEGADSARLHLAVFAGQEELGELLLNAVSGEKIIGRRELDLDDPPTHIFLGSVDDPAGSAATASAMLLLVRFMDALTMDRLKAIRGKLPEKPMAVLLFREPDEIDFKISCPACGQKLWVRDTDEGKRGRCPNCKTSFHLPSQPQYAKSELALQGDVPVTRVVGQDTRSCRNALENLRGHLVAGGEKTPFAADLLDRQTAKHPVPDASKGEG